MLTIVLSSRRKGNLSSRLDSLLDSITDNTSDGEKSLIEVIVKFDSDDEIPVFISNSQYPFTIKYLSYSRAEGRYDLYNFINYLITLRDEKSRFIMTIADDFLITKPFVNQILSCDSNYRILGGANNPTHPDLLTIPLGANHRNRIEWEPFIGAYCPIISVNLIKIVGCFGISPSTDAWAVALALAVYKLYGVDIWQPLESFYHRNEIYDKPGYIGLQPEHHKTAYPYNQLDIMNHRHNYNPMFWDIIESQAKNIYLNMKYDGVI